MEKHTILAPLDSADLINRGLLGPGKSTGSIRIHKRRLNRSSDKENQEIPMNVSLTSPEADFAFATIPIALVSYETLLYVGLNETRATELWNRWTNWPAHGPRRETDADDGGLIVFFKDFIVESLENRADTTDENNQRWRECLEDSGMELDVQEAILDPHFWQIRASQSCLYWVKDTVQMRYAGLEDIQQSSRAREMELRRMATRPSSDHPAGGSRHGGQSSETPVSITSSSSTNRGQRSVSGFQQQYTPGIELDNWGSASALAARSAPGYVSLFKGVDQARVKGLFDDDGNVDRISTLLSSAPSDFSGTRALFYFSPDYKVAVHYAGYAKRRANCESVVIVCLKIPNSAIESLSPPDIQRVSWPSDEWKQLIWHCRTARALPSHLRKYRQATLVIGTISRKPDSEYHELDSWQQITDKYLLKVGPSTQATPAVQYVFSGEEEGREFLLENGARSLQVFPYPQSELEAWLAANPLAEQVGGGVA